MSNEDETIQRMSATIQENIRELLKQDDEIKSLRKELEEAKAKIEELQCKLNRTTNPF